MINAIIVDDERHCIDRLRYLVANHCQKEVAITGACTSIEDAISLCDSLKPQLIFLDIQVNNLTGFDLLQHYAKVPFKIIFTTAYEHYAVKAFKFSAVDYLLKPVDADDLKASISKIVSSTDALGNYSETIEELAFNVKQLQLQSKRIAMPTISGLVMLVVNDIVRCESSINYTTIFLKDGQKLVVAKTLKDFEELLTGYNFFRVHNSHLVNLACIKSYSKGKAGSVQIDDGTYIEVSTRRKDELLKRLMSS